MNSSSLKSRDSTLRRYLLGQLPDEEQTAIEERFFIDDNYFQQVELAEDDLIEAYERGELSSGERVRFENHFLSTPERRRQLQLIRTLRGVFGKPAVKPIRPRAWWTVPAAPRMTGWLAVAAALIVMLTATGYLGTRLAQQRTMAVEQRRQLEHQLAARDTRINQLENQLREQVSRTPPAESKPRPALGLLSFILTPSLVTRGETARTSTLIIPSDTTPVALSLDVELESEQEYESYRVVLETSQGAQVWARDGSRPVRRGATRTVVVSLPAGLLQPEQYRAKMFGRRPPDVVEEIDEYAFRVVRR